MDNFFLCNITPLFFIETLADLEKHTRSKQNPEDIVGSLAYKTPDFDSKLNAYHTTLLEGELLGVNKLDMEYGRPHISGGRAVELGDKKGIIFKLSPEEEAFRRWQDHDFLNLERLHAKKWRHNLSSVDLESRYKEFQKFFPLGKPKSLKNIKQYVDFYINESDQLTVLNFGLSLLNVPTLATTFVVDRWRSLGRPSVQTFAPYFAHVFSVTFLFYLAIAADLVGRGRQSHIIDLAYLYYLPFCMVFSSNDKLHSDLVPLFLRENQSYIRGIELKADLGKLDKHYDSFPDDIKNAGVLNFARYPPEDKSFLVTQLWDKHVSQKWREHKTSSRSIVDEGLDEKIIGEIRRFENEATAIPEGRHVGIEEAGHIIFERKVRPKKGKWIRFKVEPIKNAS